MNYKKNGLIFLTSFIIGIQILLYINNNQKSSFRYFIWTIKEIEIGKLISFSFLTGFLISSVINVSFNEKNKKTLLKENDKGNIEEQEEFDPSGDESTSFDIPPQRDLREVQPTISVNYRVIKNTNRDEYKETEEQIYKDDFKEDWNNMNEDKDW